MTPRRTLPAHGAVLAVLAGLLLGGCATDWSRWTPWPPVAQRVERVAPPAEVQAAAATPPPVIGHEVPPPAAPATMPDTTVQTQPPLASELPGPPPPTPPTATPAAAPAATPADTPVAAAPAEAAPSLPNQLYFDRDAYKVRPADQPLIAAHARRLKASPQLHVTLRGHADPEGPLDYNLALARKRADTVRKLLIAQGARPQQVDIVSLGEARGMSSSGTGHHVASDRRVELVYR